MILLLDSTVLIDILRSRNGRRALMKDLLEQGHVLTTCVVNHAEVFAGSRPEEEAEIEALFARLDCYTVTAAIARRAGSIKNLSARKGRTVALADALIAATAIEHDLTLVTDNRKDFLSSELKLYTLPDNHQ